MSPGFWRRREREGGQAGGFAGGDAQQPQPGLGELIDGDLVDASGAPLGARHLPRLDVAQRARRQAAGDVQDVQAGTGEEPGRLPWAGEFILGGTYLYGDWSASADGVLPDGLLQSGR